MADEDRNLCGEVIDARYRVECCIGQGGMGVVWRVRHVQTRQLFALKTVHGRGSHDRKALRRLLHEARATAAIQSRNVVRIVDVNSDYVHDGLELPYIVMEFLEGESLSEYLESGHTIDSGELIWVMRQVSRGLCLAHERGIIHRDLKPSNVFLSKDEDGSVAVKVCDFGIAKLQGTALVDLAETGTLSTETGALFGTPRYMAPEQLRRVGSEGTSTDQWSFGLIVFRAIAGRSYFEGARNLAELILAIVHDPLPEPSSLSPLVPPALNAWFLRSCARDPDERFAGIETQQQELELALGSPPAKPIEVGQLRAGRATSSNPASRSDLSLRKLVDSSSDARIRRARTYVAVFYTCLGAATITSFAATNWLAAQIRTQRISPAATHNVVVQRTSGIESDKRPLSPSSTRAEELVVEPSSATASLPKQASLPPTPHANPRHPPGADNRASHAAPTISPDLLPRGAPCIRSAQCKDGLCAAEVCQ
jgi:serine/threonine protein kinase